ncbi:hypothetical protein BOTCAL_0098g00130 [Botryotinia calthae]|uniref:Uncharacterized protein n=1 Tax=Botryotinia calthae TaxID=38488 RepID=A0A4Y8D8X8_9HELO|nr:hypothetical protein BOTCAL_0098g00130 [Botryotinia calthae]
MIRLNGTTTRTLAHSALDVRQLVMLISDTNAALELLQIDLKSQNDDKDVIQRIQDILGTFTKKGRALDEGIMSAVAKYNGCVVGWIKAMKGEFETNPHMLETLKEGDTFIERSKILPLLEDKEEVVKEADYDAVDDDAWGVEANDGGWGNGGDNGSGRYWREQS